MRITATARRHGDAVVVEVHPGGALAALTLSDRARALGAAGLAETIVDAVAEATALANQRTRHELGEALTRLRMAGDADRAEQAEATTPATWRV
ncbi:hypothetical protein [Actinophytocola sp.]|uniref:hypothetical protein n=1 Tax=Actinophytocola sp. TaxID=1872138 RepID=UPI002D8075A4|nr:hypothetical protein [Actinophytocola sp.]HET9138739.1 hypothetical protein [Actinophytocola sp.]